MNTLLATLRLPLSRASRLQWFASRLLVYVLAAVAGAALFVLGAFVYVQIAHARDNGQWDAVDPEVGAWYRDLKQPDNPSVSCCGKADAYYADTTYTKDGKNIAVITDERDDAPLGRPHVPVGTEIAIPDHKMKWDSGNPTGHNVIFLSNPAADGRRDVYCFVDGNGV